MPEAPKLRALATANRNLANVLMYQERHSSALDAYQSVERYLAGLMGPSAIGAGGDRDLNEELAHLALNRANALTFLDRPSEAESALLQAIDIFDHLKDRLNRGRAHTNLGRLYLREGRYAAALDHFNRSARDLIGDITVDASVDVNDLRQADELLLEHAAAYLSLNLYQEAAGALQRCEVLFRSGEQPFELARTRYTQGLLHLYASNHEASRSALTEALRIFRELQNRLWSNRTITALAATDFQNGRSTGGDSGADRPAGTRRSGGSRCGSNPMGSQQPSRKHVCSTQGYCLTWAESAMRSGVWTRSPMSLGKLGGRGARLRPSPICIFAWSICAAAVVRRMGSRKSLTAILCMH